KMAMEGDWVAASACACARDPADSIVKQIVAQSTTIASGREDRALLWHRTNALRVPFRRSAAALTLTLPPPSCVAPGKALYARRQSGRGMAIQRRMERGKAVPRQSRLRHDQRHGGHQLDKRPTHRWAEERAEEAGLSNTPSRFA